MNPPDNAPAVKPIPDGYPILAPYLILNDATAALDFYRRAFSATERMRMPAPGGKIGHAEIEIAGALIMLADECPQASGMKSPHGCGTTTVCIHLYVSDVDALCAQASAAGATVVQPLENKFYGDRSCSLSDPFGHVWSLATHVEDVPPEEMERRAKEAFSGG